MKIPALLLLAICAGCVDEKTYDVAYYAAHPKERAAKMAECLNNPGEKFLQANCINARQAAHKANFSGSTMAGF